MPVNPRSVMGLISGTSLRVPAMAFLLPFSTLKGRTLRTEVQIPTTCTHLGKEGLGEMRMDYQPSFAAGSVDPSREGGG